MGCGTEDDGGLAQGAFNEADSHKSFLDALNEWRAGNRGGSQAVDEPVSSQGAGELEVVGELCRAWRHCQ